MSGLLAWIGDPGAEPPLARLQQLASSQVHRGRQVVLEHSPTLAFVALDASLQCDPASATWVLADARLDDRQALLQRLRAAGQAQPATATAAMLLAAAYRAFGTDCARYLRGDYAFLIWDGHRRQLLAWRDPFGKRGLFYARTASGWVFASDRTAVLQLGGLPVVLDEQAVADYLMFGEPAWADPAKTVFAGVSALPPAHRLELEAGQLRLARHWQLPLQQVRRFADPRECIAEFRSLLKAAVRDRVEARRVAVSLSGGLDSTAILTLAAELQREGSGPATLSATTLVYRQLHQSEDGVLAEQTARRLGVAWLPVEGDDYPLLQPDFPTDTPTQYFTPACFGALHERAAGVAEVLLTGASADNLLAPAATSILAQLWHGGWRQTRQALAVLQQRFAYRPRLGTGLLRRRCAPALAPPGWLQPDLVQRLGLAERFPAIMHWQPVPAHPRFPGAHQALVQPPWLLDRPRLPSAFTYAEDSDPFMDLRLVEFVFALPPLPWLFRKYLLRAAMQGAIPDELLWRRKVLLGDLLGSLLARCDPAHLELDDYPAIDPWVDRKRVPALHAAARADSLAPYSDIRPLLLARWLRHLPELLRVPTTC